MDINRNMADGSEVLKVRSVQGFTTVTSGPVHNAVDCNEDCQYKFHNADGHVMDSLIADFCDLSLRRLGAHTSASSGGPG